MELPDVGALASYVRAFVLGRRDEVLPPLADDHAVVAVVRQFATVIIGAAGPFAANSYSRARLIRQMHASGLLSAPPTGSNGGAPD